MNNFRHIGFSDVAIAAAILPFHAAHFSDETYRQNYAGSAHPESETVYLRMPPVLSLEGMFSSLEVENRPLMLVPEFAELVYAMASKIAGRLARVMLIKLKAGGRIHPHIDQGDYAEATDRYHLPIITNDGAWLRSGSETKHLAAGEIWAFNKHVLHEGANEGTEDRIHLVADFFKVAA